MADSSSAYRDLEAHCQRIDSRQTKYRFDLEADIPWHRIGESGTYFTDGLLQSLGVTVASLRAVPGAFELFQWAFALATCEEFIALEQLILRFEERERSQLGGTRSVELLCEEERKHIAMFQRYGDALRSQEPERAAEFARLYRAPETLIGHVEARGKYRSDAAYHYVFWLNTLFFEDYTIYLHKRLAEDVAELQPAWLAAHHAHRREEEQHVVTDVAYLNAIALEPRERKQLSTMFFLEIGDHYAQFFALDTPRRLVAAAYPGVEVLGPSANLLRSELLTDILTSPTFRRTRAAAPYLQQLAQQRGGEARAVAPAPVSASEQPSLAAEQAPDDGAVSRLRRSAGGLLRGIRQRVEQVALGTDRGQPEWERFTPRATAASESQLGAAAVVPVAPVARNEVRSAITMEEIRHIWAMVLERSPDAIDVDAPFVELGGDSLEVVEIHAALEARLGRTLGPEILFSCSTVREFAEYLSIEQAPRQAVTVSAVVTKRGVVTGDIAVVAAAGRFPGADDLPALWELVAGGRSEFRTVPPDRWDAERYHDPDPRAPGKTVCVTGAFLDDIRSFDPEAFGLTDRDAAEMDPQQRLFLELAGDLLDQTGERSRDVGVYVGAGWNEYFLRYHDEPQLISGLSALGNLDNMTAARVSQLLGLTGPAMAINAACASSLVAIHTACKALQAGECAVAIAGGVELNLSPLGYLMFSQTGVLSPSNACRPFSSEADGFVPGEGGGAVLLESLARAEQHGHEVLAVIRGSAVNNDGRALSGMATNPRGQVEVLRRAYEAAAVDPSTVTYIEAHGSGTRIGDPIEVQALAQVFAPRPDGAVRCGIGSIKSNIGHLFSASGIAGFLKVLLALRNRQLPPIAGCELPNPRIGFAATPFYPVQSLAPWHPANGVPRRAGVSAFGVGGTNCHIVVEESRPAESSVGRQRDAELVCVSAPSDQELPRVAEHYAQCFQTSTGEPVVLGATCGAINRRASRFPSRRALVVTDAADARAQLLSLTGGTRPLAAPKLALVFSGPGSQYPGMGLHLYANEPVFRDAISSCSTLLEPHLERRLEEYLYRERNPDAAGMDRIDVTQPIVFSFGYALARWLESLGLKPDAVLGHSAGEYIAACVAGALSLEDAVVLVTRRGQCMARTEPGKMAAVFTDEQRLRDLLEQFPLVGVGAVNEPGQVVLSGGSAAMDGLLAQLATEGVAARELAISCAAHSPLMEPAQAELARYLEDLSTSPLRVPIYSTARAGRIDAGATLDADYWREHLRAPVRFAEAVRQAWDDGVRAFVEVGASGALTHCVRQTLGDQPGLTATPVMRRSAPHSWVPAMEGLGTLFEAGVDLDLERLATGPRLATPAYPYRRRPFWLASSTTVAGGAARGHRFSLETEPSVRDHIARGTPIAPAARLMELVLSQASGLRDVLIGRPLALADGPRWVEVQRADSEGSGSIAVRSRAAGGGEAIEHLTATVAEPCEPSEVELAQVRERCGRELPVDAFYDQLAGSGLTYGATMRTITSVHRGDAEVLARIELPAGEPARAFHPGVVDGAMQAIAGLAFDFDSADDEPRTFLGFAMERVSVHAATPTRAYVHVRLTGELTPDSESFRCDVRICDDTGAPVVSFDGVALKRMRERTNVQLAPVLWRPCVAAPPRRGLPESLLVIANGVQVAAPALAALRRGLEDAGVHIMVAAAPVDGHAATALVERFAPVEAVAILEPTVEQLLVFCRALIEVEASSVHDLFVAGRDAAPLGFLRTVAQEQPGWHCRGVHCPTGYPDLAAEFMCAEERTVVGYHDGERVEPYIGEPCKVQEGEPVRAGGVYWITGGLGGIGVELGLALGRRYGARLLLTGRREQPDTKVVKRLERAGAEVLYVAADVCDREAMARARDAAVDRWGAIHGVVHAAGLLDDELVAHRSTSRAQAVLAPKVVGAELLLELLSGMKLDFVAMCSSLAALFGNPGQADYAAGNASLDERARGATGSGTRIVSINWGPWRDTGMVSDPRYRGRFSAHGLVPLSSHDGARAFIAALGAGHRQLVAVGLEPGRSAALRQLFNRAQPPISSSVAHVPDADKLPLGKFLQANLAAMLKVSPSNVDLRAPFSALGVDSLMAVELVLRLERRFGVKLYPTLLFEHQTIDEVVAALGERLDAGAGKAAPGATVSTPVESVELPEVHEVDQALTSGHPAYLVHAAENLGLLPTRVEAGPVGPGEVAIEVQSAGVNFIDLLAVMGMHPVLGPARFVPGHEVSGVVCELGEGVDGLTVGDRVLAIVRCGGYAGRVVTPAPSVARLPDGLSFDDGAAVVITGLTAIACVEQYGGVASGDKVLVQAAAGATGTACVQLALAAGAEVFGTAGSSEKLEVLRELGVHHPINYREQRFDEAVRELVGRGGIDVVIDSLSGEAIQQGLSLLRPGGRFIEIGGAGLVEVPPVDPRRLFRDNLSFIGCNVGRLEDDPRRLRRHMQRLLELLSAGTLRAAVGQRLSFDQAAEAHELLRTRKNVGKIVLGF